MLVPAKSSEAYKLHHQSCTTFLRAFLSVAGRNSGLKLAHSGALRQRAGVVADVERDDLDTFDRVWVELAQNRDNRRKQEKAFAQQWDTIFP